MVVPPIVLLVDDDDDDDDTVALYDALLTAHGYWVARAASTAEALECAHGLRPDLIVTDVGLGGEMDGTRLIRELQSREKLRTIPVLVVTGRSPRHLPTFAGLAISGLLVKPVAPDTLLSRVEHILREAGADLPPSQRAHDSGASGMDGSVRRQEQVQGS